VAVVAGADVVERFEQAFKNEGNHGIVDELLTEDFVHHLPYPGLPPGRAGMGMVGEQVRADTGATITWVENHIYRVAGDRIAELWPAGGPQL
jgi:hypothetical protein